MEIFAHIIICFSDKITAVIPLLSKRDNITSGCQFVVQSALHVVYLIKFILGRTNKGDNLCFFVKDVL